MMISPTHIVLVGLGREGLSSYHFFAKQYPEVSWILTDDRQLDALEEHWQQLVAKGGAQFVPLSSLADWSANSANNSALLLVKTAGIPLENAGVRACLERGATLTSNTAAFFATLPTLPVKPRTIGITGTKGKSTTSSMIFHCLRENGVPVVLAGNIGVPPLNALEDPILTTATADKPPVVVLELSSHQLRELTISPEIAVIQDITPEHLDYYASFDEYLAAKAPITQFQTAQDWVLSNPAYSAPAHLIAQSQAKRLYFGISPELEPDSSVRSERGSNEPQPTEPESNQPNQVVSQHPPLTADVHDGWIWVGTQRVLETNAVPLVGAHNLLNTLPAVVISSTLFAIPLEGIASAIRSFAGLPHRLEFAGEVHGVRYYNDSQATAPEATMAALASFPGKSLVLLAGGSDKGVSFAQLGAEILRHNVQTLLLFPPMGAQIWEAVQAAATATPGSSLPATKTVTSMQEAVELAAAHATPGSIVLLSPACASFGLFKNYQDRGDQFKSAVHDLDQPETGSSN